MFKIWKNSYYHTIGVNQVAVTVRKKYQAFNEKRLCKLQSQQLRVHSMASNEDRLAAVKDVMIDRDGRQADIYDAECSKLEPIGLDCECLGGGRVLTNSAAKTINVYGYSMGFGRADHQITCDIIKRSYPDYTITWSNEGY
ncbi:PHPT1 [Bugula neritina]|uniref:PHPT1 n=1 Tax=Bugula neritina TaxID=10212 RepID=A0A7J7J858_BUGNE|nr:PHPT1 [Bugula neritina]